jgi:acetyltransferase
MSFADLKRFFAPRSVAFVGATEDLGKFGGRCMRLLIDFGYEGAIYPVNPKRAEIFGRKCYASIGELPETPDHVGIVLPAAAVPAALEECARRRVPFATVFTSGFSETGTAEGISLQQRLVEIARSGGVRVMGPNCNGLVNFVERFALTSTAAIKGPRRAAGDIGIASQSGGAGQINVMWRAQQAGLGVRYQVSCGNNADLDLLDYMAFMVEDPNTRVVLAIAEHLDDGERLRALARRAAQARQADRDGQGRAHRGRQSRGGFAHRRGHRLGRGVRRRAAPDRNPARRGYERALRGGDAVAARSPGRRATRIRDFGVGRQPGHDRRSRRVAGDRVPTLCRSNATAAGRAAAGIQRGSNPTDLTTVAIGRKDAFASVCRVIAADPAIDTVIPVLTMSPAEEIRSVAEFSAACEKPVAILWTGGAIDDPALAASTLVAEGHAVYRDTLPCLKAVRASMQYGDFRRSLEHPAPTRPGNVDTARARNVGTRVEREL